VTCTSTSRAACHAKHQSPRQPAEKRPDKFSQPYKHPRMPHRPRDRHVGGKIGFWRWESFLKLLSCHRRRLYAGLSLVLYVVVGLAHVLALSSGRCPCVSESAVRTLKSNRVRNCCNGHGMKHTVYRTTIQRGPSELQTGSHRLKRNSEPPRRQLMNFYPLFPTCVHLSHHCRHQPQPGF
jgi:hypothetical protein